MRSCPVCGGLDFDEDGQRVVCHKCGALARGAVDPSQISSNSDYGKLTIKPENKSKTILMITGAVAALLIFLGIIGSVTSPPSSQSTQSASVSSDSTDAPTSGPDEHMQRASARTWYLQIVNDLAIAHAGGAVSGDDIKAGDFAAASSLLKKASEAADRAIATSTNGPDDVDWGDVPQEFNESSVSLRDALNGIRKALDDNEPSTIADASDSLSASTQAYESAVHDARIKFEAMGGKWSDLPDGQSLETSVEALLRSAP